MKKQEKIIISFIGTILGIILFVFGGLWLFEGSFTSTVIKYSTFLNIFLTTIIALITFLYYLATKNIASSTEKSVKKTEEMIFEREKELEKKKNWFYVKLLAEIHSNESMIKSILNNYKKFEIEDLPKGLIKTQINDTKVEDEIFNLFRKENISLNNVNTYFKIIRFYEDIVKIVKINQLILESVYSGKRIDQSIFILIQDVYKEDKVDCTFFKQLIVILLKDSIKLSSEIIKDLSLEIECDINNIFKI